MVHEELAATEIPLWVNPEWGRRFPWLVQGTTGRGSDDDFDFGLFGGRPAGEVIGRWASLRRATGMPTSVHARQVHGADVRRWSGALPEGMVLTGEGDAHLADVSGLLLTVSIADCVPLFIVDAERRRIALVHAGWRGVAGGIVERALGEVLDHGGNLASLWLHSGPAICGACYEVGPEVHRAVTPERAPPGMPTPIDLRAAIARRAVKRGIMEEQITTSACCTRCTPERFHSHRAGSPGRQLGILGRRE